MENNNLNPNATYSDPVRQEPTIRTNMGSPEAPRRSGGKGFPKWIAAVIGVMLILAIGGFFIARSLGEATDAEPSPSGGGLSTFPTPDSTTTPEPTPETREVEKSEVRIEVLNGTGTPGEASFLQGELEELGYEEIEVANAESQDETTTTVTFADDLPEEIVEEITEALEEIYDSVETETGGLSGDLDIRILTGPRSGAATSSPSATSSPRATSTSSPTPTASPSN